MPTGASAAISVRLTKTAVKRLRHRHRLAVGLSLTGTRDGADPTPLFNAFIRRKGYEPDRAQELTQDLFVRLLEKEVLSEADPTRGRFRAFLRAVCADFLANRRDWEGARKRGGGRVILMIDVAEAEGRYAREPAHELDAVHAAFLVPVDQEPEVERVIEDLAREWEGRIDVQLLGPMAAYDFAGTAQPEGLHEPMPGQDSCTGQR